VPGVNPKQFNPNGNVKFKSETLVITYDSSNAKTSFNPAPSGTTIDEKLPSNNVMSDVLFGQLSEQVQLVRLLLFPQPQLIS
jgi:uncharacterized protein YccT (UPF0319 family)